MIGKYKWIIDTQLPPKLINIFIDLGYDAVHTKSYSEGIFLSDTAIRKLALQENRIIITKDSDFYNSHFIDAKMPPVLYLKIGNISNKDLISLIKNNLSTIVLAFDQGARLIMIEGSNLYVF
ncbi:MAG: DUF5615 family PIN-like protein [Saprospiraceae bacterium]